MPYQLENFFPGDRQHSFKKNEAVKLFRSIVSTATRAEINPATGRRRTGAELDDVAYVRPHLNNLKIYLLPAFFEHHRTNQFTGAGVVFHELSHMFANTDDHRYMAHPCRQLAQNQPQLARNNADNYRLYFEEFMR